MGKFDKISDAELLMEFENRKAMAIEIKALRRKLNEAKVELVIFEEAVCELDGELGLRRIRERISRIKSR